MLKFFKHWEQRRELRKLSTAEKELLLTPALDVMLRNEEDSIPAAYGIAWSNDKDAETLKRKGIIVQVMDLSNQEVYKVDSYVMSEIVKHPQLINWPARKVEWIEGKWNA